MRAGVCKMKFISFRILFAFMLLQYAAAQSSIVTSYTAAEEISLPCSISADTITAAWIESGQDGAADAPIYTLVRPTGIVQDLREGGVDKYYNFDTSLDSTIVSLVIRPVQEDDGGTYTCSIVSSNLDESGTIRQILRVEVPGNVAITDASDVPIDVTVGEPYSLTCQATGARSFNQLSLVWNPESGDVEKPTDPASDGENPMDYSSTINYAPRKDDTSITCTLGGFESQIPAAQVSDTVTVNVRYRPECNLTASPNEDDCTMVTLTCTCDAQPVVDSYEFQQDGELISGTDGNSADATVEMGDTTPFSCRASNTIDGISGSGELAHLTGGYLCPTTLAEKYLSEMSTTAARTTTLPTTGPTTTEDPSGISFGLIVVIVISVVVVMVVIIILVWYFMQKGGDILKGTAQKSNTTSQEATGADDAAYMDLEERTKTNEKSDSPGEIPEANVTIVSDFPSSGSMVVYRKVQIIRNSRQDDAVARSLSDAAPIAQLKLWNAEIKSLQSLPQQQNIAEVFGWCNAVPNFLLMELITGGDLLQHLSDNFGSHKLHQYGNIKKKKFVVPERGDLDTLPRYALDVSRGLRFLQTNKFIHPGLRAEKVLVDSAGRCKLYDIVSMERAEKVTTLLWRESVPYRWMSPEYLLLGTMVPAGDVWSFGVLLWEIFSYGSQPYPGEGRDDVENSLRRSDRLSMPQNCPGAIWQLMIQCWEKSPEGRPKLEEITSKLSTMCNENKEYEEIRNQRPLV